MTKEQLKKAVKLELEWLKYYALREDRKIYDPSKLAYEQLRSIGYAKVNTPLPIRCGFLRVTAVKPISSVTKLKELIISSSNRNIEQNIFTALDFWTIKYPEDREWVKKQIYNE